MSQEEVSNENITPQVCPIKYMLSIIGGKWKQPIICILASEPSLRNSTIKRRLPGITNMMLSQSLKELEREGIIHRKQFNEVPPHVEYSLTEKGKTLLPILHEMQKWALQHMEPTNRCESCVSTE
ncbi:transcriptional regulator, HxlR family [Lachnospiraceae bacterium KM106-2]|nr:transcriptional regulator, HxlR family [Lachnospiraceae bacterium KM106-2]